MGEPGTAQVTVTRRPWAPLLILLASLAITSVITRYVADTARAKDQERFRSASQSAQDAIEERLTIYVTLLRTTAAHLSTGPTDYAKYKTYVENLKLRKIYPGVQGLGYTVRVPGDFEIELCEAIRKQYFPDFNYWPAHGGERHAIVWLEPLDRRNAAAIGYDMFSEPVRRAAMERARDTGEPAASGKVVLVQEIDSRKQSGFLIYMPVYESWVTPDKLEDRRARLLGFVYSPFRADDLLSGVLASKNERGVGFEIYDGSADSNNLLYRSPNYPAQASARPRITSERQFKVCGNQWTVRYASDAWFQGASSQEYTLIVLLSGILVSLGFAGTSWMQWRGHHAAERLAGQLTRSENTLRLMQAEERERLEHLVMERTSQLQTSQERLRLTERLASLGTLSTGIAHEINNPVNAILLSAEYALTVQDEPNAQDETSRALTDIVAQSKRCGKIVRNVLRFARQEGTQRSLQDINEVVRRAAELTRSYVGASRIALRMDLDPALPPVLMDATLIEQVLVNLIQNAAEAATGDVEVTLSTQRSHEEVIIRVADNGPGIAPADLRHIFDPFFSTRRERGGTGLGLSMVHGIVTEHQGYIDVESQPGRGAVFTIHLPLADARSTANHSAAMQSQE